MNKFLRKRKYVTSNQSPFMNKTLSKVIMIRTNRSNENKTNTE